MCFLRPTAHIPEYYLKLRHIERQDFKLSQHTGSTRQIKSHTETLPQIKPHAGTVPQINLNTWTPLQIKSHIRAVKGKVIPLQAVVSQRVSRGIAPLFHDRGTRRRWVVSSTPRPHFTPEKDPVPILQEAGRAPGPVWTGRKSRPHRDFFFALNACIYSKSTYTAQICTEFHNIHIYNSRITAGRFTACNHKKKIN